MSITLPGWIKGNDQRDRLTLVEGGNNNRRKEERRRKKEEEKSQSRMFGN